MLVCLEAIVTLCLCTTRRSVMGIKSGMTFARFVNHVTPIITLCVSILVINATIPCGLRAALRMVRTITVIMFVPLLTMVSARLVTDALRMIHTVIVVMTVPLSPRVSPRVP